MIEAIDKSHPVNTPVLFLVFNRIETTKKVFESIRLAKPKKLYVASDGPRKNRLDEEKKVNEVREYILSNIDWPCEVNTLFRDTNLGCGVGVSSAISWFFENEEMGIVLEDDCLPSLSFFYYCQRLLEKYKDDERIMQINGSSFLNLPKEHSYFFSKYNHIWGWASWRRAWKHYQFKRENFKDDFFKMTWNTSDEKRYWYKRFQSYFSGDIDTWDYPWTFTVWQKNGLSIYPSVNMIENLGFGPEATHTTQEDSEFSRLSAYEINYINHPETVFVSKKYDTKNFKIIGMKPVYYRAFLRAKRVLKFFIKSNQF